MDSNGRDQANFALNLKGAGAETISKARDALQEVVQFLGQEAAKETSTSKSPPMPPLLPGPSSSSSASNGPRSHMSQSSSARNSRQGQLNILDRQLDIRQIFASLFSPYQRTASLASASSRQRSASSVNWASLIHSPLKGYSGLLNIAGFPVQSLVYKIKNPQFWWKFMRIIKENDKGNKEVLSRVQKPMPPKRQSKSLKIKSPVKRWAPEVEKLMDRQVLKVKKAIQASSSPLNDKRDQTSQTDPLPVTKSISLGDSGEETRVFVRAE
eukprot:Seg1810.10 transcript_id=Seg1810.10/GoldUCD/mRNA.D3Y31 product="hypothetical protein" protein_id=Seg1810.10/GoldUCD/D3Y31